MIVFYLFSKCEIKRQFNLSKFIRKINLEEFKQLNLNNNDKHQYYPKNFCKDNWTQQLCQTKCLRYYDHVGRLFYYVVADLLCKFSTNWGHLNKHRLIELYCANEGIKIALNIRWLRIEFIYLLRKYSLYWCNFNISK